MRTISFDVQPLLQSCSVARAKLRDLLTGNASEEQCAAAELVVGELVSNAVVHGLPPIRVKMTCREMAVRIQVYDGDGRISRVSSSARDEPADYGRGLRIVEGLAAVWGVIAEGDGKTVFADVPLMFLP